MPKNYYKNIGVFGYGAASKDFIDHQNFFNVKIYARGEKVDNKTFFSKEDILSDKDIQIIYVPTPINSHFSVCKEIIEHGKSVIVEKTATTKTKDYKKLIKLATKNNVFIVENDKLIDSDMHFLIKELSKKYGRIKYMHLPYIRNSSRPLKEIYSKEKMLDSSFEIGVYPLSLALLFLNVSEYSFKSIQKSGVDYLTSYTLMSNDSIADVVVSRNIISNLDNSYILFEKGILSWKTDKDKYHKLSYSFKDSNGKTLEKGETKVDKSRFSHINSIVGIFKEIEKRNSKKIEMRNLHTLKKIEVIEKIYK